MRTLILSAPVGESHLAMARALETGLAERDPGAATVVCNRWSVLGPALGRILGGGYSYHLGDVGWTYELAYRLFTRMRPARRAAELALGAAGGAALAALIRKQRPDLVVSTHPVLTTVLGRLRAQGRVRCPAAAVVGPIGGLDFWAHPGIDLHLLLYAEVLPEVEREAGPGRSIAVRPLVGDAFLTARDRAEARARAGCAADRRLVVISGGGWGAGDLDGAIGAALAVPGVDVIAVAGRNEAARAQLARRHSSDQRVTVLGFTDRMADLLAAADAFVASTAGLSCLEADLSGCPVVCYGFAVGHIRDNVRALVRHGLARAAGTPAQLTVQLGAVLDGRRAPGLPDRRALPAGADVLGELAGRRCPTGQVTPHPGAIGGNGLARGIGSRVPSSRR